MSQTSQETPQAWFGELRSLLQTPCEEAWARLCALCETCWAEDVGRFTEEWVPYITHALRRWPAALCVAPHDWMEESDGLDALLAIPRAWRYTRALPGTSVISGISYEDALYRSMRKLPSLEKLELTNASLTALEQLGLLWPTHAALRAVTIGMSDDCFTHANLRMLRPLLTHPRDTALLFRAWMLHLSITPHADASADAPGDATPGARADAHILATELSDRGMGKTWKAISRERAVNLGAAILHRTLAYSAEIMPLDQARALSEAFGAWFDDDAVFLTGISPESIPADGLLRSYSVSPLYLDSTFDMGLAAVDTRRCGLLWTWDED